MSKSGNNIVLSILEFLWIPLLIGGFFLVREIIGVESTERVVEQVEFSSTVKYTDQLTSGVICYKPEGVNGVVVKNYKVIKKFGNAVSRELIDEEVTREVKNEIKVVGTKPKHDGYCSVEGTYRKRYAQCYGDYSEESKQKAEEQAHICNVSPYNESGCYDTYYSSIYNGTKSCPEIKVEEL